MKTLRYIASVALAAGGMGLTQMGSGPETITVCATGCDHATVAAAVRSADAGDTIEIAAGRYAASGVVVDKPVVIRGVGRSLTVLDGGGREDAERLGNLVIAPEAAGEVVVEDLTLANPSATAPGGTTYAVSVLNRRSAADTDAITLQRVDVEGAGTGVYALGLGGAEPMLEISDSAFHADRAVVVDSYQANVVVAGNVFAADDAVAVVGAPSTFPRMISNNRVTG